MKCITVLSGQIMLDFLIQVCALKKLLHNFPDASSAERSSKNLHVTLNMQIT